MSAQDDMDAARAVLDLLPRGRGNKKHQTVSTLVAPVVTAHDDVDVRNDAATDDDMAPDLDEKTENDADYDMVDDDSGIKPLFDKAGILNKGIKGGRSNGKALLEKGRH